jgi:hypothetical protein
MRVFTLQRRVWMPIGHEPGKYVKVSNYVWVTLDQSIKKQNDSSEIVLNESFVKSSVKKKVKCY